VPVEQGRRGGLGAVGTPADRDEIVPICRTARMHRGRPAVRCCEAPKPARASRSTA